MSSPERRPPSTFKKRALETMALVGAAFAVEHFDPPQAHAETPHTEQQAGKTMEDVQRERGEMIKDRQELVNKTFTGVHLDLSIGHGGDMDCMESYGLTVNGVFLGEITYKGLFAKRLDFYTYSDNQFLADVKAKLSQAQISFNDAGVHPSAQPTVERTSPETPITKARQATLQERQATVQQAFHGARVELSIPDQLDQAQYDTEVYVLTINGVKVDKIAHGANFVAHNGTDFYKFKETDFLDIIREHLVAAKVPYTEDRTVQAKVEQTAASAAIEETKARVHLDIASDAQTLIEETWHGKITGWVTTAEGNLEYQFRMSERLDDVYNLTDDVTGFKVTKLDDHIVMVKLTFNDNSENTVVFKDGVQQ